MRSLFLFRKVTYCKEAKMEITVRKAKRSELEQINQLRKTVNTLHVNGRPDIFREGFCEQLQQHVYACFEEEEFDVLAAAMAGEICGYAIVKYVEKPLSPYNNARRIYQVEEFGVAEQARRRGVATALMDYMRQDAIAKGYDRIELDVWEFNENARAFYEAVGFQTYRRYLEMPL